MLIVLDDAGSILDPQGTNAQVIYASVEEPSRFGNTCLCITSRITTIPLCCETIHIPALSMGAACDSFYHIYKVDRWSSPVNGVLRRLDFHPLSVSLFAAVAHRNVWDTYPASIMRASPPPSRFHSPHR